MSGVAVESITLDVEGKQVEAVFVFSGNATVTTCILPSLKNMNKLPPSGSTIKNPKDVQNIPYAKRLALWRACLWIDGAWMFLEAPSSSDPHQQGRLGPLGRAIYDAFRLYQRSKTSD